MKHLSECSVSSFDTPTHAHFAKSHIGTPLYMAPEIYAGSRYGMPCDVFSLGLVYWTIAELHAEGPTVILLKGPSKPIGKFFAELFFPDTYCAPATDLLVLDPKAKNSSQKEIELMNSMLQAKPENRPSMLRVTEMLANFKSLC